MGMPNQLILVRHGQSEANIVQKGEKHNPDFVAPEGFYDRHDSEQRLSPLGVEQAKLAGQWILDNLGNPAEIFDRCMVSSYIRARETAAYVGGPACEWLIDDRLRERDWGVYGATPLEERKERFAHTERLRKQSYWYTPFDGGEGMASDIHFQVRDVLGTLHREMDGKRVLVVAHGDRIGGFRFVVENCLPEEWEIMDNDKAQEPTNGSLLIYSRENPEDQEDVRKNVTWRRMIRPDDPDNSPFGGEWVQLDGKRRFSGEQLLAMAEAIPRLIVPGTTAMSRAMDAGVETISDAVD